MSHSAVLCFVCLESAKEHYAHPVQVDKAIHLYDCRSGLPKRCTVWRCPLSGKRATEPTVGISQFLSESDTSFSGVLKQRYSDFIVHEVRLRMFILVSWLPSSVLVAHVVHV